VISRGDGERHVDDGIEGDDCDESDAIEDAEIILFETEMLIKSFHVIGLDGMAPTYVSSKAKAIIHQLSIYTSMKHSLLLHKLLALSNSLDTLSDARIKAFMLLF
jgi:hypothetical protein